MPGANSCVNGMRQDLYRNPATGQKAPVPRHREIMETLCEVIRKQLASRNSHLEQSRCWGNGDARLTCVACHDVHKPRVQDAAFYDKVCLGCHSAASDAQKGRAHAIGTCKVSKHDCVTCHMPKYTIPSMHTAFTDHKIAVHGDQFTE